MLLTLRAWPALAVLALGAALPARPGDRPAPERTMAVTVDDLPALPSRDVAQMRRITDGVLAALRRHQVTAVGFVNENKLEPLGELLDRLAGRGYRFVALDEALADEAWRAPDEYVGSRGPSWLYRFRVARGLPLGLEREPDPPRWVLDLYREAQR